MFVGRRLAIKRDQTPNHVHRWTNLISNIFFKFLDEPLAYLTVTYTRVSDFISPNAMSLVGVAVAAVSARFLAREELKYRQLGVLVFAVRDYIDALDGSIFRERSHSHAAGQVGK